MLYALKPNNDRIDQKITVVTFPFHRTSRPRTFRKYIFLKNQKIVYLRKGERKEHTLYA